MVVRVVRSGSAGRFAPPPKRSLSLAETSAENSLKRTLEEPAMSSSVKLTDRLCNDFGGLAQNEKVKAIISAEVTNYLRLGRKTITEEDIAGLESRVRTVLQGGRMTQNDKVMYKRQMADADEWARLYAFLDQEGEVKEKERRAQEAKRRAQVQDFQKAQVADDGVKHKKEVADELAYAQKVDADFKKWQQEDAGLQARRKEAMHKLKASVEEQLAERQERKQLEATLKLQEEQNSASELAAELKAKMEAEATAVTKAKEDLKTLLAANEVNKAIKEKQRLEDQALDRKYARQYADKLDKEEKARLAQLAKRAEYQARQAVIAEKLPESKRWIDPAIIERNFMEVAVSFGHSAREEAEEKKEADRKSKAKAAQDIFKVELSEQIKGRQVARQQSLARSAAQEQAFEARYQNEVAKSEAEKQKVLAKKDQLRKQLQEQLEEALARKMTVDPAMTKTEREINADTLRRMQAAETRIGA